ncbi:Hpt domain protein [compost metagenome]
MRGALQLWSDAPLEHEPEENEKLASTVVDHYAIAHELEADLRALKVAYRVGDADEAAHYAHRLVGACEVLGALQIAILAKGLELKLKHGANSITQVDLRELAELETSLLNWIKTGVTEKNIKSE